MSVAACTSQPQNEYINNSGLEAETKSSYSRSFEQNKQHIPVGTWEGIERSGAEFKVLKITPDNLHTFTSYKIATGMHHYKKISFTNNDIKCDEFNCIILSHTANENLPLKIILTAQAGQNYSVTEAILLTSKEILSTRYELKPTKEKSTPKRFIAQEAKKITLIASKHKKKRFGYWSGVLELANDGDLKFATLEYLPEQTAIFTVYTPGLNGKAVMTFEHEWLKQSSGELNSKLEGAPFASEITLRYVLRDMIEGDFELRFERYPERLLGYGHFRLNRVRPPGEYKTPVWLKALFKKTK
ncbi:MAG: hypothetical protein HRU38_02930 [Saccharospirillaceae bacterium]|nr:hypothetical protein [Saccharospirillaceae bacterium]